MQELPIKSSLRMLKRRAASMTLFWIARFRKRKSPGKSLLALMPPTLAAARKTYSGRWVSKKRSTSALSERSSSAELRPRRFVKP